MFTPSCRSVFFFFFSKLWMKRKGECSLAFIISPRSASHAGVLSPCQRLADTIQGAFGLGNVYLAVVGSCRRY